MNHKEYQEERRWWWWRQQPLSLLQPCDKCDPRDRFLVFLEGIVLAHFLQGTKFNCVTLRCWSAEAGIFKSSLWLCTHIRQVLWVRTNTFFLLGDKAAFITYTCLLYALSNPWENCFDGTERKRGTNNIEPRCKVAKGKYWMEEGIGLMEIIWVNAANVTQPTL